MSEEARKRVDPLLVFIARAEARALIAYAAAVDADLAFDALIDDAFASGLLDDVGQPMLEKIIAKAFEKYAEAE